MLRLENKVISPVLMVNAVNYIKDYTAQVGGPCLQNEIIQFRKVCPSLFVLILMLTSLAKLMLTRTMYNVYNTNLILFNSHA